MNPLDINDFPWVYERNNNNARGKDVGKWMLFFDKPLINEVWSLAKTLYFENKLDDIQSMKCSTNYENPRSAYPDKGIVILYCYDSSNEEAIMRAGRNLLDKFNYTFSKYIYYKTDVQTSVGTAALGVKKNYTYILYNHLYRDPIKGKCLIKLR